MAVTPDRGSGAGGALSRQGNTWTIVAILAAGAVLFAVLGGASGDGGCGDSPPYLSEEARICFRIGYDGPLDSEVLMPVLDLSLDEARALADDEGWTMYVKRRDDGLVPEVVGDDERPDRIGVELADGRVVRIWPG